MKERSTQTTCPKCDSTLTQEEVSDGYEFECHECDEDFYGFEVKWREIMGNKFNLEKALAGEPVVTREGNEVTQLTLFEMNGEYNLVGIVAGALSRFTKEGVYYKGTVSQDDLFMKPKTHIVNGFEVPKPTTEQPEKGSHYYLPNVVSTRWFTTAAWNGGGTDLMHLKQRSIVFLNKEDAIANAKAMAGIDPYGESND